LCAQLPESAGLQLRYQAPDGCPDRAGFEQQLRARLPQRGARAGAARLEVRITRVPEGSVGELALARPGGEPAAVRKIRARDCEEAAEALALVAALMLDPPLPGPVQAAPGATSPAAPAPARGSAALESRAAGAESGQGMQREAVPDARPAAVPDARLNGAPASADAAREPAAVAPPPPAQQSEARATGPAAPQRRTAARPVRRQLALAAALLVAGGVAPVARVGGAFALGLASHRRRLELAGRLGVRVVQRYESEHDEGSVAIDWWSGSAAACAGAPLFARGALSGCLAGELGRLRARGAETLMPASSERLWGALGPALAGRWRAVGPLSVEGSLLALFPFARHRYVLADETVFSVPRLTFRVELGVVLHFP
jgi:hypothetical protein